MFKNKPVKRKLEIQLEALNDTKDTLYQALESRDVKMIEVTTDALCKILNTIY